MDDALPFLRAFHSLPTPHLRRKALEALLPELSSDEWRMLQSAASARSLQLDIIAHLPVELVAQVFSHLDIAHPYRLQLVSRQWHHVLRSLVVQQTSLDSWYHGTVDLSHVDYPRCKELARQVHAFRTGSPSYAILIMLSQFVRALALMGDTMIWLPDNSKASHQRSVYLVDLSSWVFREFHGEACENIYSFVASEEIVAAVTYTNLCYVWEIHGQASKKFILPSLDYSYSVACRGRTIACAALTGDLLSVYIWNFDTQQGQSFQSSRYVAADLLLGNATRIGRKQSLWLLLQPRTSSIIVVGETQYDNCGVQDGFKTGNTPLVSSRFTYDGKCLDRFFLPHSEQYSDIQLQGNTSFVPIGTQGHFMLDAICTVSDDKSIKKKVRLEFDENANQFLTTGPRAWSPIWRSWWNDTFCDTNPHVLWGGMKCGPIKITVGNTNGFETILEVQERMDQCFDYPEDLGQVINDKYVVRNLSQGFAVFCFNESENRPQTTANHVAGVDLFINCRELPYHRVLKSSCRAREEREQ